MLSILTNILVCNFNYYFGSYLIQIGIFAATLFCEICVLYYKYFRNTVCTPRARTPFVGVLHPSVPTQCVCVRTPRARTPCGGVDMVKHCTPSIWSSQ